MSIPPEANARQVIKLKKQTKDTYDYIADTYAIEWSPRADLEIVNKFLDILPENKRLLDVGCGPGHYSKIFSEKGHLVTGLDLSAKMLEQAKLIWHKGKFVQMDMQYMGFQNNAFDAIWVCASFSHIPEIVVLPTLLEFRRLLRKGGLLFINAKIDASPIVIESVEEMKDYKKEGRFFQRYSSSEHFANYLQQANFSIVDIFEREHFVTGKNSKIAPKPENTIAHWINYYCI